MLSAVPPVQDLQESNGFPPSISIDLPELKGSTSICSPTPTDSPTDTLVDPSSMRSRCTTFSSTASSLDDAKNEEKSFAILAEQVAGRSHRYSTRFPALHATSIHAFSRAEKTAFVKHINKVLEHVPELSDRLPIDPESNDIFEVVKDGVLLCKLINASVPGTIDEKKMIKYFNDEKSVIYHRIVNQNLCIDGARQIGAIIVNLGAEDLLEGKIGLLKEVTLEKHPELLRLKEGEEDISNLPPEELLLKWVNYHLKKADVAERVENFSSDLKNSAAYVHLLHRLDPENCSLDVLEEDDLLTRAEKMLFTAEKMGCRTFVTPEDVVAGNEKLNLVFVANMFNKHTGMVPVAEEMEEENRKLLAENQSLREAVQALERNVKYVQDEQATCDGELVALNEEKKQLTKTIDTLTFEREQLALKVHNIFDMNAKLQTQISAIHNEKQEVELSKQQLSDRYDSVMARLKNTTNELERERIHLETSEFCGASLANDLEELRSRQEKMEYLIEHLKLERLRSEMHVERLRILYNSFNSTEELCHAIYGSLSLEVISVGATKVGYLTKKARNSNSWKYRFFVLRDNFLFYFRSDKDPKMNASGVVRVDDAILRFAENPTRKNLKDQWLLCIEVPNSHDAGKPLSFYIAGEDHELEGWKSQIQTAAGWWTKKSSISSIKKQSAASRQVLKVKN